MCGGVESLSFFAVTLCAPAFAQNLPAKPVRIRVGFAAAGSTEVDKWAKVIKAAKIPLQERSHDHDHQPFTGQH